MFALHFVGERRRLPDMKFILLLALLAIVTPGNAETPRIQVRASYNGLNLPLAPSASGKEGIHDSMDELKQPFTGPSITSHPGQRGEIELTREMTVPGSPEKVLAGVILDVTPTIREGRIVLTGKSTIRRALGPMTGQPIAVGGFDTREVFFDGFVEDGKPITIRLGDGPADKAEITITAKRVTADP